ncbi:hypothetical protein CWI38_1055p0030 [Hamiltosporidium tvaerminnensis]|uniref:Serine-threonine kinase receptor-associated protein n=1 Tax=Hamiltosporidium tvaerminnensis TaxID=1176355 RepID=A0A4Q9L1L3_9MICR|nr:Eukaryotic translation initiation factor 3 subunit I [Hamiltosporidium tvaerminnensis]TBU01264.1 hypothetical protein CWI37_0758p0020 [Hamiltosporidium tvaerminnensis]TBU11749.1 hypothetical protein CWI38_1055p0030 [Hamiltosporidium tvaerminnensis]
MTSETKKETKITKEGKLTTFTVHSRPITDLAFNEDGDLLFSTSLDGLLCAWRTNGIFLGSYDGHEGTIWCLSVDPFSTHLMSGGADNAAILWELETGKQISKITTNSMVRGLNFFRDGQKCLITTDTSYSQRSLIGIFDIRSNALSFKINPDVSVTKGIVDFSENLVAFSDSTGEISLLDIRNEKIIKSVKVHTSRINNLRLSFCRTFFSTASSDAQAKIVDFENISVMKTFTAEEPLNSSVIFRTNDKLIAAGGIAARDVTQTKGKDSFDVNFYDIPTAKMVGTYSLHFGTINCVDVHPSNNYFCSGGEDGIISFLEFGSEFSKAAFSKLEI